jgi:hypothetical protein
MGGRAVPFHAEAAKVPNPDYENWRHRCAAALRACNALGGDARPLCIGPPATDIEVAEIERALGLTLPASFRRVLTEFSAEFQVAWFLPHGMKTPFTDIFCGDLTWSLRRLPALEEGHRRWVTNAFPNPHDPYDSVWHGKMAVHEVGNGDYLALDLVRADAPLVYLSHDDGQGHGYILGNNFEDAVSRWIPLGFVGAEDWQWMPFVTSAGSGIDPTCANARRWRDWFGIDKQLR